MRVPSKAPRALVKRTVAGLTIAAILLLTLVGQRVGRARAHLH